MSDAIVGGRFVPRAVGAMAVTGITYGLFFPQRTDYLGHYLAGFGATLGVLSFVWLIPTDWRPTTVVTISLAAIGLGWVTEQTIFKLAIFDPVDFFNQSLGAVVAAGLTLGDEGGPATGALAFMIGLGMVIAGFYFAFA